MSADCCGGAPAPDPRAMAEPGESLRFWQVCVLQASLLAALLLPAGLVARTSSAHVSEVASVGALLLGGWIFVPDGSVTHCPPSVPWTCGGSVRRS